MTESPLAAAAYLLYKSTSGLGADDKALAETALNALVMERPTSERGVALAMLNRALGSSLKAAPSSINLDLGADWKKTESALGRNVWQYRGAAPLAKLPADLETGGKSVQVVYDSFQKEDASLPVKIERTLSKLTPGEDSDDGQSFGISPVGDNWELSSKEIYLDKITITPPENGNLRFGLLEIALPPGAEVEQTTWGIKIKGDGDKDLEFGQLPLQTGEKSYSVAIENLSNPITVVHLVRFSQAGNFEIPPTRFFKRYAPGQKAFERGDRLASTKISVR